MLTSRTFFHKSTQKGNDEIVLAIHENRLNAVLDVMCIREIKGIRNPIG